MNTELQYAEKLVASAADLIQERLNSKKFFDLTLLHPLPVDREDPIFKSLQTFHCVEWEEMGEGRSKLVRDATMFLVDKYYLKKELSNA